MTDKPRWMDYADLAAKIAVPVVLFIASLHFNAAQARAHAEENCLDLQMKMFTLGCADRDCSVTQQRATTLIGFDGLISERCKNAGIAPVQQVRQVLKTASQQTNDAKVSAALQKAAGTPPPKAALPVNGPVALSQQTQTAAASSSAGPHVYVQITDEGQRDAAKALIQRLRGSTFNGATIAADGPELVQGYPLRETELRCLKAQDCRRAADLAAYVGLQLGREIRVRDLSARYDANARVKAGNFELWFASR